jgi:hypothetical protein
MEFQILFSNITNPVLLFFVLGIVAASLKSDLEIPANSSKFISLYLLFSIGFKGGQELAVSGFNSDILYSLIFGLALASLIPLYTFFITPKKNRCQQCCCCCCRLWFGKCSNLCGSHFVFRNAKYYLGGAYGGGNGIDGIAGNHCRCNIVDAI